MEKIIQELQVTPKTITTDFVYKRQKMANKDLAEIERAGQTAIFLQWMSLELEQMIVNTIVMAVLVGDQVNASPHKITVFESIGTKDTTDAFTFVKTLASGATPTVSDYRNIVDNMSNPYGKRKVLCMSQLDLTAISAFTYASGGTTHFRTKDEMAGQLGVDEIYVTDILQLLPGVKAVCLIPDGYWFNEMQSQAIDVVYPTWEKNEMNYQKEKYIGGAIHDLLSTSVLKIAQTSGN
jgi:hypothetical protein